jgi:RHS repeat-associated protein
MEYDYTGMRVKKHGGGITRYPFQGVEIDPNGVMTKFIRIGTENFASHKGTGDERYYYHNDHLGSVNVITDGNGVQIQVNEYDPWGKISRSEGAADPTHAFTGQEIDSESGIQYYGGRYYNQLIGRFISADPFVQEPDNPQNLNRYSYVINNPQNYTDPSGYDFDFNPFELALVLFAAPGPSSNSGGSDGGSVNFEGFGDPAANALVAGTLNFFLGNIGGAASGAASGGSNGGRGLDLGGFQTVLDAGG